MANLRRFGVVAVCAFFIFLAFGSIEPDDDGPTVTSPGDESAAEEGDESGDDDSAQLDIAQIGDEIDMGDSKWIVMDAEDLGSELSSTNQFIDDLNTDGRFVRVEFKIENNTNEEVRIWDTPPIEDAQGRNFEQIDQQSSYLPEDANTLLLEAIPAGMSREFYGIYEVAPGAEGLQFMARDFASFNTSYFPVDLEL